MEDRIIIRVPENLKEVFFEAVKKEGLYNSPSEALRAMMIDYIKNSQK